MPTIAVPKGDLYKSLGKKYTRDEFDDLCFEFGLELDEEEEDQLKIEVPANRYDMLCYEGIAMNLNVFLGRQKMPDFTLKPPQGGELVTAHVREETARIRPYFSCAVLRGIKFTKERYDSFIALQDKLHQNLARQRTLVSIGAHDLDTIEPPFSYEALPPEEIVFAPLNQTKKMNAREMMQFYEKDAHLSRYLHIIRDSPVYPIIYDQKRRVLSMPPIINSDHSKITLDTQNVFIDITATDRTKLEIVNHILVAMFSQYCAEPFTIEPVQVLSDHNGQTRVTPDLTPRATQASSDYLNSVCGLSESRESLCALLKKMCYHAKPSTTDQDKLDVDVPVTRADVLHEADIMEDVAIAYGFNNLPRHFPGTAHSVAATLPINKLTDIVRTEAFGAGWKEVMPLILCSHDENYAWLNNPDDKKECVRLQNPKTAEYQIVRTSLVPGLLKTLRENRKHSVPMNIFEVGDVCFKDETLERRSRNDKHFAAAWYGKTSGFEHVHGLLDRVMQMLKSALITREEGLLLANKSEKDGDHVGGYWVEDEEDAMFLPGCSGRVFVQVQGETRCIGKLGILHPTVLRRFELPFPTSTLELDLEVFL